MGVLTGITKSAAQTPTDFSRASGTLTGNSKSHYSLSNPLIFQNGNSALFQDGNVYILWQLYQAVVNVFTKD